MQSLRGHDIQAEHLQAWRRTAQQQAQQQHHLSRGAAFMSSSYAACPSAPVAPSSSQDSESVLSEVLLCKGAIGKRDVSWYSISSTSVRRA